ncbi:hypothetical protein FM103_18855 [Corynebacterium xerosis]|nr:hypothetical protein FM103_18855 [Corynebacterium xerosis]
MCIDTGWGGRSDGSRFRPGQSPPRTPERARSLGIWMSIWNPCCAS